MRIFRALTFLFLTYSFTTSCKQLNITLMIINGTILTMNKNKEIIENGAVAIQDNNIVDIGSTSYIKSKYKSKKTLDAQKNLVMPGLINGHTHAAMVLLRGYAEDLSLKNWLNNYIWPAENKFMTAENVYWSTLLACLEMIKGGTTTFVDMYLHEDKVAQAVEKVGIRAILGHRSCGSNLLQAQKELKTFIEKWKNHPLITPAVSTHSPYICEKTELLMAKEISDIYKVPLLMHVSESKQEIKKSLEKFKLTPIEYLNSIGFLSNRFIGAHLIYVTDNEIELIKKNDVGAIHCATSNMKLASGIAPVDKFINKHVLVGLGTDGAASNNSLDMITEMKIASLAQKVIRLNPKILPAYKMVELATIGGAKAIHMDKQIGSLEKNKRADIIIVSMDKIHQTPVYNPVSQLVFSSKSSDVKTVIINGKILMHNYKLLLKINENEIKSIVNKIKKKISDFYKKNKQQVTH